MKLIQGDCLEKLKQLKDNSVDSIVTDPPYGISFMGKKWDYDVPNVDVWKEVLRVLKPGGYALIACGTRTQHRMAVNLEDAGFEIRDVVAWLYGSGFPKSLNVHKKDSRCPKGWGTALKPAMELWTLCRKPLEEKTVAKNVLKYGVGGINIDGCRVEAGKGDEPKYNNANGVFKNSGNGKEQEQYVMQNYKKTFKSTTGRFPANIILDEEAGKILDEQSGVSKSSIRKGGKGGSGVYKGGFGDGAVGGQTDKGGASRFFYCAKASKSERNKGCEELPLGEPPASARSKPAEGRQNALGEPRQNNHPTVKPIKLMRYLCRLITPKNGIVLDPYMGSGSTGIAAKLEDFDFIGIEREEDYIKIAEARINNWEQDKQQTLLHKE